MTRRRIDPVLRAFVIAGCVGVSSYILAALLLRLLFGWPSW